MSHSLDDKLKSRRTGGQIMAEFEETKKSLSALLVESYPHARIYGPPEAELAFASLVESLVWFLIARQESEEEC